MKVKILALVGVVVALLLGSVAQAQPQPPEPSYPKSEAVIRRANGGDVPFKIELALTPEQQEQIAAIIAAQGKKQQTIREEAEGAAIREQMTTLREETNGELLAVLTADQKQAWETLLGPAPAEPERRQRPE